MYSATEPVGDARNLWIALTLTRALRARRARPPEVPEKAPLCSRARSVRKHLVRWRLLKDSRFLEYTRFINTKFLSLSRHQSENPAANPAIQWPIRSMSQQTEPVIRSMSLSRESEPIFEPKSKLDSAETHSCESWFRAGSELGSDSWIQHLINTKSWSREYILAGLHWLTFINDPFTLTRALRARRARPPEVPLQPRAQRA